MYELKICIMMQYDAVNIYFPKINPQCYHSQKNTSSEGKKEWEKKKASLLLASLNNANKSFYSEAQ